LRKARESHLVWMSLRSLRLPPAGLVSLLDKGAKELNDVGHHLFQLNNDFTVSRVEEAVFTDIIEAY